jgi:hypothetical protein
MLVHFTAPRTTAERYRDLIFALTHARKRVNAASLGASAEAFDDRARS